MLLLDIDHVQLAAPPGCEAKARDFFGRLLELQEIEKPAALRSREAAVGSKWAPSRFTSALKRRFGRPKKRMWPLLRLTLTLCTAPWKKRTSNAFGMKPSAVCGAFMLTIHGAIGWSSPNGLLLP